MLQTPGQDNVSAFGAWYCPDREDRRFRRVAAWRREVERARWAKPTGIKAVHEAADVVGNSRVVFDICGNRYRLIVQFNYAAQVARIRFAGTHAEYDDIDATTV